MKTIRRPVFRMIGAALLVCLLLILTTGSRPALAEDCYYTVMPGDTLTSIAARYGVDPNSIVVANKIPNPNAIYAGQTLIIPNCGAQPAPPPPTPPPPPNPGAISYTVPFGRWNVDMLYQPPPPPPPLPASVQQSVDAATVQVYTAAQGINRVDSGVVVQPDGRTILTTFHIVGDLNTGQIYSPLQIYVGPYMGYTLVASLVAVAPQFDLALVRIDPRPDFPGFAYIPIGNSDVPQLGSPMYFFAYSNTTNGSLDRSNGSLIAIARNQTTNRREGFLINALPPNTTADGIVVDYNGYLIGIVTLAAQTHQSLYAAGAHNIYNYTPVLPINLADPLLYAP